MTPEYLARARRMAGLTQREIAAGMDVSTSRICLLEKQRSCTAEVAQRYLHAVVVAAAEKRGH